MSETNDSGNRWETKSRGNEATDRINPAEADESAEATAAPAEVDPIEVPSSPAVAEPAAPATESRTSRLPSWVTKTGLVTTGAAAAIFLGGGGVGYAIGVNHDGSSAPQGRFDRAGFNGQGPDGQFPGNGQMPGGQGQNFGGPNSQQAPQGQSQSQGQSQGQSQSQSQGQSQSNGSSSGSGTSS